MTRADVTEEQPRVAETTHPTPPHQKRHPKTTGTEHKRKNRGKNGGEKNKNILSACLKMRWSGDVRFYTWRQKKGKREGRKKQGKKLGEREGEREKKEKDRE